MWIALYALVALGYLFSIARFWDPETGFTQLIFFGKAFEENSLPAIKETPHFVHPRTPGYDGQFYAQIAIDPTLRDPNLDRAIDNLPYRARRIGMPLLSWMLGLGTPLWILNVFALINPIAWIGSSLMLLRWLPPTNAQNFIRWAGFLLGLGMIVSTRYALPDGPAAFLVILAVYQLDRKRPIASSALISLAVLTKETSVLAGSLFVDSTDRISERWKRLALQFAIITSPIALWIIYIHLAVPEAGGNFSGIRNFDYPFFGYFQKWIEVIDYAINGKSWRTAIIMAAAHIATSIFMITLIFRPQPGNPWWRVGIAFAILGIFLGPNVWETFPGATCRVLLCTHLAFNLIVPRTKRWLVILLIANFAAINAPRTLRLPSDIPQDAHLFDSSQIESPITYPSTNRRSPVDG